MPKLTRSSLALSARKLSADVDSARWALAELAAQAKADAVPDWAAIIGAECRRAANTVEKWARTWEWSNSLQFDDNDPPLTLPYSFYECAAKHSEALGDAMLIELLFAAEMDGAKYEAFRAQLSTLAGKPGYQSGDFPAWVKQERKRIADWIDRMPTMRARECLILASAALKDAETACDALMDAERVTA